MRDFITMYQDQDEAVRLRFWDLYNILDHTERATYDRVMLKTALEIATDTDRAEVAALLVTAEERLDAGRS
jgi:hypothetical protein